MSRTRKLTGLLSLCLTLALASPLRADEAARLAGGLAQIARQDWPAALSVADQSGPIGADLIRWFWLRAGEGRLGDYEAFLQRRPDWPGLRGLREKGELAVYRSTDPARVLSYFRDYTPRLAKGAIALVRAHQALGRAAEAEETAALAWSRLVFDPAEEAEMIALAGPALSVVHDLRLDNLLWEGDRRAEAERMLDHVAPPMRALARARLALRAGSDQAASLVEQVPGDLRGDPGLAYDRFVFRMKRDRYADATALILDRSDSAQTLGRPEAWAERRAQLARRLMRTGDAQNAYRVAAGHHLTGGDDYVDLEFLSGFIALRKLGDADRALRHFSHLKGAVETPISLARADYWTARALEAKGDSAAAETAYRAAARHQTAYYGLLAAERLGLALDRDLIDPPRPGADISSFEGASSLTAGLLLARAGDRTTAKRFLLHLGESLSDAERAALSELALRIQEPHIAVLIAKQAVERGLVLPRAYYPVPDFIPEAGLPISRALALSIARRESEFDPAAQSPAGARGLMQVMPDTGKLVAGELGIAHETSWLISRPEHNILIGSAYLAHMVERFGPAIALIASGYNAGPRRPEQWIAEFGDPRDPSVDVIDWVETIPFAETRTYVMRVAEGVVIYRARLKGASGPINLTGELTGR